MSIPAMAIALAAQAAGQEVTTFHPLPSDRKGLHAEAPRQAGPPAARAAEAPAPPQAKAEDIKVVSVKDVPADANVRFVPPPPPQ